MLIVNNERLKSDYFRIEISVTVGVILHSHMLKSDYFRIEILQVHVWVYYLYRS